ncbi:PPK2 family polyphosphate kinase [Paenibacillus gansuensis]|uniref:PPK2 family polyphosphate kinase n=1 Tax=Paenibacillus gansuensis TaxID=306542 RepID=A0ABW5PH52_9BACL
MKRTKLDLPVGGRTALSSIDPKDTGGIGSKTDVAEEVKKLEEELEELQDKLYAGKKKAVLFLFQGMDCSGKDGVIHHVFSALNPAGLVMHSFKAPTEEERSHDFLWRAHQKLPAYGYVGAFNRSYYEEVLIRRVHKEVSDKQAKSLFKHINHFEKLITDNGIVLVKIFLHISKQFQLEKLKDRVDRPEKNWKFDPNDLVEREAWDEYQRYYEDVFTNCGKHAPWYIVPSDQRWYRDYAVLKLAVQTLRAMDLQYPEPNPEFKVLFLTDK